MSMESDSSSSARLEDITDCIQSLQTAAEELGESPTRQQYDTLGLRPSSAEIERRCGTWNKAKTMAGLETVPRPKGWTRIDCIAAYKSAADMLGHAPSRSEYESLDYQPSVQTIYRIVGWSETKRLLGYTVNEAYLQEFTKEDCIESVLVVTEALGEVPTVTQYREFGIAPSAKTISTKFDGGWRAVTQQVHTRLYNDDSPYSEEV